MIQFEATEFFNSHKGVLQRKKKLEYEVFFVMPTCLSDLLCLGSYFTNIEKKNGNDNLPESFDNV
jgi:hypothetical protein